MSELRKANTDATYFLTFTVVGWIDVFTRYRYCDEAINSLRYCQENKGLDIFAYVIMPSHIHLVARNIDANLHGIIRDFKSYTAKRIIDLIESEAGESRREWLLHLFKYHAKFSSQNKKYQFWQKTSYPIALLSPDMIDQKIDPNSRLGVLTVARVSRVTYMRVPTKKEKLFKARLSRGRIKSLRTTK